MPRQEINPNELSIRASNFGGLNTVSSPVNIPIEDATELVNVDVDLSGSLTKRLGTFCLDATNVTTPNLHYNVITNNRTNLLFQVHDRDVAVKWVNNNIVQTLQTFDNTFRLIQQQPFFVPIAGSVPRLLILNEQECPVQFQFHEFIATVNTAGNSFDFTSSSVVDLISDSTAAGNVHVFINDIYDSGASASFASNTLTVTPSNALVVSDKIKILYITWQWWAEAEIWRGDNFYRQVPRFNANDADRLVLVPNTIYSDLKETEPPYGISAYFSNNPNSFSSSQTTLRDIRYIFQSNRQPTRDFQYTFSNGALSNSATDSVIVPSPFAIVFGALSSPIVRSYNPITNISPSDFIFLGQNDFVQGDLVSIVTPDSGGAANEVDRFDPSDGWYVIKLQEDAPFIAFGDDPLVPMNTLTIPDPASTTLSGINTTNGLITTPGNHPFDNSDTVRWTSTINSYPATVDPTFTYFVKDISATSFELYFDPALQIQFIPGSGGGGLQIVSYLDNTFTIEKKNYEDVFFVRLRQFSFNNGKGQVLKETAMAAVDWIVWSIDGDWNNGLTEAPLFDLLNDDAFHGLVLSQGVIGTNFGAATNVQGFYSFVGGDDSIQTEDSLCRIVNTEPRWTGSAAQSKIYQVTDRSSHLGGIYPVYGFGLYANYDEGIFPTVGVIHQERLYIGGLLNNPNLVVASAISDLLVRGEFYNYFQITDDLDNGVNNPFDFTLNADINTIVNGFISWQQLLFIFTEDYVFRNIDTNNVLSVSNRGFTIISNSGLVSKYGTTVADNQIFFLSRDGVYDIPIVFENEYRTNEISLDIRTIFDNTSDRYSFVNYDKRRKKLYVGIQNSNNYNTRLYVCSLINNAWTEYFSNCGFNAWYGDYYIDHTLGEFFLIGSAATYFKGFLKFDHDKPIDFAKVFAAGVTATTDICLYTEAISTGQSLVIADSLLWSPFREVSDISVYNDAGTLLVFQTDYYKINQNTIQLTAAGLAKITTNIFIVSNYSGTWFGTAMFLDDIAVEIDTDVDFGNINLADLDGYNFDTHDYRIDYSYTGDLFPTVTTGMTEYETTVGFVYPCFYKSASINQEVLFRTKQLSELMFWFSNITERLASTNELKFVSQVDIGMLHDTTNDGNVVVDIYDDSSNVVNQDDFFTLFKIRIPQNTQQLNVVIWSANHYMFRCDAYQVNLQLADGSGYVSGLG